MEELLVFGSEDCMSWEETTEVLDRLENDDEVPVSFRILDPVENSELFKKYELVICPSIVHQDELISVGPPNFDYLKQKILETK